MASVSELSRQFIYSTIKEILSNADLNVITSKIVRIQLQSKLNLSDLNERKDEINAIIKDVLKSMNDTNDERNGGKSETKQTETHTRSGASNEQKAKTKLKEENNSDSSNDNRESKTKIESESESDSDDVDVKGSESDEELARKLHEREVDSRLRSNRNKTKTSVRKSTKKRKKRSDDDNHDQKESGKKRKNGYLKPCVLSAEMAEFMGQTESPRCEVVKRIWDYCKEKNLMDPKNKQFAICDNELSKIFGKRKRIRLFGMMKHLSKHLQ